MTRYQHIGLHLLRYGLAAVYLWFGFSQLLDSANWVSLVPEWASDLLRVPPAFLVLGNGAFEVVAGMLLAAGFLVRPVAVLLAAHLAFITLEMGFTAIGVRDLGLTLATLSLALLYEQSVSPYRFRWKKEAGREA